MKKLGILLLISFCLLGCQPRDEVPTPEKVSEIEISKSYTCLLYTSYHIYLQINMISYNYAKGDD